MAKSSIFISGAVEGLLDEAVLRQLVEYEGAILEPVYGKNGKPHLKEKLVGYNQASRRFPWVILMDLDQDAECAPLLLRECLPDPSQYMHFRIAVRAIEAWLLADNESLASFLSVAVSRIPLNPEALDDPKQTIVELANYSRRREIREDMVPRPGSGRKVGPAYTSQLIEFVQTQWCPEVAADRSDSLHRCRQRIRELVRIQTQHITK